MLQEIQGGSGGNGATITKIGSGDTASTQTYSARDIPNYQNLTADNFMIKVTNMSLSGSITATVLTKPMISYNPSTGNVTVGKFLLNGGGAPGTIYGCYLYYDLYCVY